MMELRLGHWRGWSAGWRRPGGALRAGCGLLLALAWLGSPGPLLAEATLSEDALADLEMKVMDADPTEAAQALAPYLAKPDRRLGPVLADLLAKGENIPVEARNALFDALVKVADKSVFGQTRKMIASGDLEHVRRAVQVMGRTRHPEAAAALASLYRERADADLQGEILAALGDLGDRSALKFVSEVSTSTKVDEVRNEAAITAVRLGSSAHIQDMLRLDAVLRQKIYDIVIHLSWASHSNPKGYRQNLRDVERMKGQVARIEAAFPVACRDHPKEVLRLLLASRLPEEMDVFHPNLGALLDAVTLSEAASLSTHPSSVIAIRALERLAAKGKEGLDQTMEATRQLIRSEDAFLRERGIELARLLPPQECETAIRHGLEDPSYRCREAALRMSRAVPPGPRREILQGYLAREGITRLRDMAEWLIENPAARVVLP
jgi:hypothetical protein